VREESVGLNGLGDKALKRIHSCAELGEVAKGNMQRIVVEVDVVWHVVLNKCLCLF